MRLALTTSLRLPQQRYATLVIALVALASCPTLQVAAQDAAIAQAKASFKAGAAAYELGDYLAAIQALEAAHRLTPLPAIAFSLAQAERREYVIAHDLAHLTRAIELFRSYLHDVPNGGRRADALDALGQLEPMMASAGASATPPQVASAAPASAAQPPETRLMVSCDAPGARVSLDTGPAARAPLIAQVTPGAHQLRIEAQGFFPYARDVEAIAGALVPIDVALRERPATLSVSAQPEASLQIDGTFVATVGAPRQLSLPSGTHIFTFAKNGHRVQTFDLRLSPGATQKLSARLEPTAQRTTSLVLFGVGAASLLGGGIFTALALDRESDAHALLEQRMRRNLSAGELQQYGENRRDRDRLRAVAVASAVGAAACLLTGLALYLFDVPEQAQR